jgi:hypothetical protein
MKTGGHFRALKTENRILKTAPLVSFNSINPIKIYCWGYRVSLLRTA